MKYNANKIVAFALLALLTGCSSTPSPMGFINHFSSAAEDEEHNKCMSENNMFNNRQLMVAPNAVGTAWNYCVKQSDVWYPGKDEEAEKVPAKWESVDFSEE
jgi:hypothetical protein